MSIYLKKTLTNSSTIGLWEITEDIDVLLSQLKLNDEENALYNGFKNDQRRLHWLSYRNLLKALVSPEEYSHVIYDEYGKPYMSTDSHLLSVAHSGKFSAAIINKRNAVGIDIELIHPRIEKVLHKFLSETETAQIAVENRLEQLFVCWGAKEALYKLYGRKELDFREHMHIKPFRYVEKGNLQAWICNEEMDEKFSLNYEKVEDYMLVYVTEEESV